MLSYSLEGQKWLGAGVITYSFFAAGDGTAFSSGLDAAEQTLAQQALSAWASVSGISFQQVAYNAQAPADLLFGFGPNLSADVYIDPDTPDSSGGFDPGQTIDLADPSSDPLVTDSAGVLRYQLDGASFYQAAAAGIGSALGLYISNDTGSIMYPVFTSANANLGASDIAGIQDLYGPPDGQPPDINDFNIEPGSSPSNPSFFNIALSQSFNNYVVFPKNYYYQITGENDTYGATLIRSDGVSFSTLNTIEVMKFADQTVVLDDLGHQIEDIARLYEGAFGRVPDLAGLEFYAGFSVYAPASLLAIAEQAASSTEYLTRYGVTSNTEFVTQIYENAAGRAPDPGGLAAYVGYLDEGVSRGSVLLAMSESQESKAYSESEIGDQDRSIVYRLNETVLGQTPAPSFLASEASVLDANSVYQNQSTQTAFQTQIASSLLLSPQYAALYGAPDNTTFVTDLFENADHRLPESAELTSYVNQLDTGTTRAALVVTFANSDEARSVFASATNDGIVHVLT
jgi:hypothetical protein